MHGDLFILRFKLFGKVMLIYDQRKKTFTTGDVKRLN